MLQQGRAQLLDQRASSVERCTEPAGYAYRNPVELLAGNPLMSSVKTQRLARCTESVEVPVETWWVSRSKPGRLSLSKPTP